MGIDLDHIAVNVGAPFDERLEEKQLGVLLLFTLVFVVVRVHVGVSLVSGGMYSNVGPAVASPSSVGVCINAWPCAFRSYIVPIALPRRCGPFLHLDAIARFGEQLASLQD
jgi:hypothetical protein